jgi:HD-GYP domain-containing protein (c-di-GMP phosphodiesterase class II)
VGLMDVKKLDRVFYKMERDMNDLYRHLERTAILSYAVAKELDLYPEELEMSYMAGLVHDIGKVDIENKLQIGDQFVDKDNIYPYFTVSFLNALEGFDKLNTVIMQHTENFDGSGFPHGLKGEEIDLIAKILKISDFYDEYRASGLSHDDVTKLLREKSDIAFPRKIITPFIKAVIKNDLHNEY